jgi:hypothetical protein
LRAKTSLLARGARGEDKIGGIVVCSDENDAIVRGTLPSENEHGLVSRNQMRAPSTSRLRVSGRCFT